MEEIESTPPVKFEEDEDDNDAGNSSDDEPTKRQKLSQHDISELSSKQIDVVPPSPSDSTVRKVADKLASFVAKNGRQFEHVTKQKNPGDTPFKFLFDESCPDYKYYEYRLSEEEEALSQTRDSHTSESGNAPPNQVASRPNAQRSQHQHSKYQIPPSALYETTYHKGASYGSSQTIGRYGESSAPSDSDPIAMMEYYMKKAAQEEKLRPPKHSKDEMPPPSSLQASKKGHHMGDYIPPEELHKFLATCNGAAVKIRSSLFVRPRGRGRMRPNNFSPNL
ncbi:SURP and G-patch domain-containing protein 1-like protein [Salvia splendens]|uniref:SURP and G-patch domain-containing protein 1-like protein n=1 Tax=Salvia splendens TaxID=180675 RepID=UPI001102DE5C|nr:SURP and G-patch domain-containing protein 1-like protein [Salvia splendens]